MRDIYPHLVNPSKYNRCSCYWMRDVCGPKAAYTSDDVPS